MKRVADVVIVGGGMVGALTAVALAETGFEVALVEHARPKNFEIDQPYDLRVSALSVASVQMLDALSVWPLITAMRACPFRRMAVWDGATGTETHFNSADIGHSQLGFIVENRLIQLGLWQVLETAAQVQLHCPAHIEHFSARRDGIEVVLDTGETIEASLLIAADGANSSVRDLAGIACDGEAYGQHALVASVRTTIDQQDITWQRFLPAGPQAFLPLVGNRASLVWYESAAVIDELKQLPLQELQSRFEEEFPTRLGGLQQIEAVGSFPIRWGQAQRYIDDRLALVGDAAHSVHPLAGQGVNMGMLDASALVQVLVEGRRKGQDAGSQRVLRRYERWRKSENGLVIKALDTTHRIFEPGAAGKRMVRNVALAGAASVSPLNRFLMKVAMGLVGDVPTLAHGVIPGKTS